MQEQLTDLPRQESPISPEHAALLASIEELELRGNSIFERFNTFYENGSEEERRCLEQVEGEYNAALSDAERSGEPKPDLALFLKDKDIPEECKDAWVTIEAIQAEFVSLETELERYVPEKAEEVLELAVHLTNTLDYDKVAAISFGEEKQYGLPDRDQNQASSVNLLDDVSKVIGIRTLMERGGQELDYSRLESIKATLSRYAKTWEESGLLGAASAVSSEAVVDVPLPEYIADMKRRIEKVTSLRLQYKAYDSENAARTRAFESFLDKNQSLDTFENIDELYRKNGMVYNEGLSAVIRQRVTRMYNELPAEYFDTDTSSESYVAFIEKARGIDAAGAVETIKMSGSFDKLPFEYGETELRHFLLRSIPPLALAAVGSVEIRPMTKDDDEDDVVSGYHSHSDDFGTSKIVISDAKVREIYDTIRELERGQDDADWVAQTIAKQNFERTIAHEFAHALHYWLPVAALSRWEEQRASDPTRVTSYVDDRFKQDHPHRFKEDFSETMKLFVDEPVELMRLSPVRYDAMRQIYNDFMPSYNGLTKILEGFRIEFAKNVGLDGQEEEEPDPDRWWGADA